MEDDTVDLFFSGKKHGGVSKSLLVAKSEYFRALFSGSFSDAHSSSYSFGELSSSGFDFLLRYLKTDTLNLKRIDFRKIESACLIADHLMIDSFVQDLRKTFLTSPTDVDARIVADLASLLNIDREEYSEKCFQEYKTYQKSHTHTAVNSPVKLFNYDILTLITSRDDFWKTERNHYCYEFFWNMTDRIENILCTALKNEASDMEKIKPLLQNLNLECVPWNSLKMLLHHSIKSENEAHNVRMVTAIQHYFSDLREQIGQKLSAIRVCYKSSKRKTSCFGILEFDLDEWAWVVKKEETKFEGKFCVMGRDYANIFGDSGQMIFRMKNYRPKFVDNLYVGEMCQWLDSYYPNVATCVLGKYVYFYLYHPHPESHVVNPLKNCIWYRRPTLFKLDVFNQEFDDCAWFPVVNATITAEGKWVYIVGFSPSSTRVIKIFTYSSDFGVTKKIVEIQTNADICQAQIHLALKDNLLYVFYQRSYWIVNVRSSADQTLQETTLECFFTQGWDFSILQLCPVQDGIVFLIDIKHNAHNCDYLGMLLAFLNTETKVFRSLGFLPNPVKEYGYFLLHSPMQIQIESRSPTSKPLLKMRGFVNGIKDLENMPHKHSSMYY